MITEKNYLALKSTEQLIKIEQAQLEAVVNNSGIALNEANEIKAVFLPFLIQLAETQAKASKIDFENPSEIDENIARELRLATVKIRTAAEKVKDEQKKMDLLKGNLKQASYNVIAASCKLTEEIFFNVEKAREIATKKMQEVLRQDREEKLSPYTESAAMYPLGLMTEDAFNDLYFGLRISHENKLEAEKKAEEDRIEAIKAEAERIESQRLDNIRLQKEAEEREKQIATEKAKIKKEIEAMEKEISIEREKARQDQYRKDADLAKERAKERKALEEKARKEAEERAKLQAVIRAKEEAELKAIREAEIKLKAEIKAQKDAEKKAELAPDKDKLLAFAKLLNDLPRPEVKSIDAASIAANVNGLLAKVYAYILENSNKL